MDSVSQFALGAAIGEYTLGRKIGRSAILLGGVLGTFPDMDVLVHYVDAVESFTYHRSWSHSVFTLSALSIVIAFFLYRFYPNRWLRPHSLAQSVVSHPRYIDWLLCCWLILVTHPILDGFTIYGTQLMWPLPLYPVAWGSMFIIDPLYTVPILISLWIAWRHRTKATRAVALGLTISCMYIGVSLVSQYHARGIALASLKSQGLATDNVLIAPAPFSVLWRIVSMDGERYHEGFYSIFDTDKDINFNAFVSGRSIIENHYEHWPIARLDWFTRKMISASPQENRLIINDLRMGVESSYVFRFDVGGIATIVDDTETSEKTTNNIEFLPELSQLLPLELNYERMRAIVRRVWDESTPIPTPTSQRLDTFDNELSSWRLSIDER